MKCKKVKSLLLKSVDDTLKDTDSLRIQRHFIECEKCQQYKNNLSKVNNNLETVFKTRKFQVSEPKIKFQSLYPIGLTLAILLVFSFLTISIIWKDSFFFNTFSQSDQIQNEDLESFFKRVMEETGRTPEGYSIIHKNLDINSKGEGIILFTEKIHNELGVSLAIVLREYFHFTDENWSWGGIRWSTWEDEENWSVIEDVSYPYFQIYYGAISNGSISKVFVGNKEATIIPVLENKRFWYAIVEEKKLPVNYEMENGDKIVVEKIQTSVR